METPTRYARVGFFSLKKNATQVVTDEGSMECRSQVEIFQYVAQEKKRKKVAAHCPGTEGDRKIPSWGLREWVRTDGVGGLSRGYDRRKNERVSEPNVRSARVVGTLPKRFPNRVT